MLSALFGLVFSGAMTSFLSCAREYAPAGRTGLSIGVVMFFAWAGMALGAWQGGLFYDICGDYFASFANASAAGVANLLMTTLYCYTLSRLSAAIRTWIGGPTAAYARARLALFVVPREASMPTQPLLQPPSSLAPRLSPGPRA